MWCEKKTVSSGECAKMSCDGKTRLFYCSKGVLEVYIGILKYSLSEGELIIIRSREPHAIRTALGEAEYLSFEFSADSVFSGIAVTEYFYDVLCAPCVHNGKIYFTRDELSKSDASAALDKLSYEALENCYGYELSAYATLVTALSFIIRDWQRNTQGLADMTKKGSVGTILQGALAYLNENPNNMSEEACASALGISTSYLSRIFKRTMGGSFCEYTNSLRLKLAEGYLLLTDMSVADISEKVGFSSVPYFISSFKTKYGFTPAKYRDFSSFPR